MNEAERLNADAHADRSGSVALRQGLRAQGDAWYELVTGRCPHLFADLPVFINASQLQQMTDVIAAVERVVNSSKWIQDAGCRIQNSGSSYPKGVFYGYDFHLNSEGAHLIEINTNAGGAFLNALLLGSQYELILPGVAVAQPDLEQVFIYMFQSEWQLQRGDAPLSLVAIIDEQPEQQYLYPEFLLAQRLFERAGIRVCIADPAALEARDGGVYVGEQQIDMVYNRLTDFSLQQYPVLLHAWQQGGVVLTPSPAHYVRYADKRNLARLTDVDELHDLGVSDADIATLQSGIPHTFVVQADLEKRLWDERKKLFFKPYSGYGSKGAYRGEKLTRRVFGEILNSGYIAQQLAPPGERCIDDGVTLKYDVRCYVYDGKIQLVAARLYHGQTTNFRTPGGGFAQVRLLG
jgi:uncharacterized protein YjiS (DUF1127 family)